MPKTNEKVCPGCGWKPKFMRHSRSLNKKTGKREDNGGVFWSCACGRLTFGTRSGYNLREK